jgi:hypothetical protein
VSLLVRVVTLVVAFVLVAAGAAFLVIHFLLGEPPTIAFGTNVKPDTGAAVNVVMQEDPQNTVTNKPDWVSYFIQDPTSHSWVHTTLFQVPAGSLIHMTIYAYDGCTPLRNPFWSYITGTIGGTADVNGTPVKVINSWNGCNVAHTFSIPSLNLNVPMASPGLTANLCSTSPCTSGPHQTMTFSFRTPRVPGTYFWQCRIPCGGGFVDGFGGPMQTFGYMTGNMEVVG